MPKKSSKPPTTDLEARTSEGSAGTVLLGEPFPLASGQVALHQNLAVLEVADPSELTALLADNRLAGFVAGRISETAAVILPDAAPKLILALLKAGIVATVIGDPDG